MVAECACALWLLLASWHQNREANYNEINPGVVLEKEHYLAGIYFNSHRRVTVFGAYRHQFTSDAAKVRLDGFIGLGTGYRHPYVGGLRIVVGQHALTFVPPTPYNSATVAYAYALWP